MFSRRIVLTLAAAAVLILAPVSRPSALALDATGVISGAENSYTLMITNTGTEPIRCFVLAPSAAAGVVFTGVSGPSGWATGTQHGRLIGGQTPGAGIPPGGSATFSFTTAGPYPERAGGDLYVSSTCQPGSDVKRTATGPNPRTVSPPPPPPPGSTPPPPTIGRDAVCECVSIAAKVTRTALNFHDQSRWHFQLTTRIICDGGGEKKCVGHVEIEPPKGYKITTKKQTVACAGKCGKRNPTQAFFVGGPHPANMNSLAERRGKTLVFTFKRSCGTLAGADHEDVGENELTVVYDSRGIPDQKRSDFNANGIPDGNERS